MVPTLSSEPAAAPPAEAGVTYRELAVPPWLAPWVRCLWELTVQGDGGSGWIVPDGFMDLVASGPVVTLAGPDTRPWPVRRAGAVAVGVRFHPGAAPALLGPPASELRDTRVTPDALWGRGGRELAERVGEAASPAARLEAMVAGLRGRLDGAAPPDPLVAAAVARLERDPDDAARVGALGPAVGLGERQLRRRFLASVGYGPKTLARVLRFQRLLALLRAGPGGPPSLAEVAVQAGYADQAHMTTECTRLAGRSPATLLAER
jgi:AraC-like DNA-binding protein